ncbi:DNA methylase [Stutzerimonas kunmingensis]|uniref:DNA methylase n=1 Tax=Stutzerimonas kunmingensis TaxID=1211807 RepID=UPI001F3D8273|nr:DNA methylase [Stutzerimonas kunmingensis]UIP32969.1 DNA methylase [Stutzerimonas kunmingensis]
MTAEIGAEDLGIDVTRGEAELFKWFVASFLFGKRIQRDIAAEAYRVLVERNRLDTPHKLRDCGQRRLVQLLGQARYVRYDESTAARLLKLGDQLLTEYDGRLGRLRELGETHDGVEKRLLAFEGIGPKTVAIFLREAARVWF